MVFSPDLKLKKKGFHYILIATLALVHTQAFALQNAAEMCTSNASDGHDLAVSTPLSMQMFGEPEKIKQEAPFQLLEANDFYQINTGAGLVVEVQKHNRLGTHIGTGDISSMRYHGVEYQNSLKGSQINSGFNQLYASQNPATVTASYVDKNHIKVVVNAGKLKHYYLFRQGVPAIFMADTFSEEPIPNLVRFVVRVPHNKLPNGAQCSEIINNIKTVEAHDIFEMSDGKIHSKHYSNSRLKDWIYFGATGKNVGIWMIRDNNEGGSGGPFYRSLKMQGASDQELTYIVNYGEAQTEPFRMNTLNQYTLYFTNGAPPSGLDVSWLRRMGLDHYIAKDQRGELAFNTVDHTKDSRPMTLALNNATAQYWGDIDLQGHAVIKDIIAGNYIATLYKGELAVATQAVEVLPEKVTTLLPFKNENDPEKDSALWRIGYWDGKPTEFLNGGQLTWMHPSDFRMQNWHVTDFRIGQQSDREFPAYLWKSVNTPIALHFNLKQVPKNAQLRIGITNAWFGGRPAIVLNGWKGQLQPMSEQPKTRTATVGTYRGKNTMFIFNIPQDVLKLGENQLQLSVISGQQGQDFLSPGFSVDAIDIVYK